MTTTEPPKLRACSCPVAGCAWKVHASAGYAAPRIDRHLRAAHPDHTTTTRPIDAGARRREEA